MACEEVIMSPACFMMFRNSVNFFALIAISCFVVSSLFSFLMMKFSSFVSSASVTMHAARPKQRANNHQNDPYLFICFTSKLMNFTELSTLRLSKNQYNKNDILLATFIMSTCDNSFFERNSVILWYSLKLLNNLNSFLAVFVCSKSPENLALRSSSFP